MNLRFKREETKFEDKNSKYEQKSTEYTFQIFNFGKVLNYVKQFF